ncbi:MAG: L-lactate dehydrogenase [Chloroflexi bacterium UTCFX4]|jgi:L-lactate dehydrogenase|nr:MAG: L-lactate dehydrogenase [Chloroflexi bacterium UTCFX4]
MKIGIVGSGFVGATAAYALVMRGVGREIILVDANKQRAAAEADDIAHAVPFANALEVHDGEYADLADARVVILAAGANQKPGETRLQLLERNAKIFGEIIPRVLEYAPDARLVVATNPVDVMTHLAAYFAKQRGVPDARVIGSGTTLDTARFRLLLARHVGIDTSHIHAHVIGEHGDSEVLTWSVATVAGFPLEQFCESHSIALDDAIRADIDTRVRRAAYHIIEGKGATYYGIGSALARITQAILNDQRAILTVCSHHENIAGVKDVTLSLPQLVGGDGILDTYMPPLNDAELNALQKSARVIRNAIDGLNLS